MKTCLTLKKQKAWNKGLTKETDERVARYARKLKGRTNYWQIGEKNMAKRPEVRKKISKNNPMKKYPELKTKASERMKINNPMFNPEIKKKLQKTMRSKEYRSMMSEIHISLGKDPEYIQKLSDAAKKNWNNPEFVKRWAKACWIRPTKPEKELIALFRNFSEKILYTGDGRSGFNINGSLPDFKLKGQKKVIELFGDYWHEEKEEHQRIRDFARHGYDCLVIWEHELKYEAKVVEKVKEFIQNG